MREHLRQWAEARGLVAVVDAAGNLLVKKSASAGCASAPGVALQAHLDMVCQATAGTPHDFLRDPVTPVLRDGWLVAEHTTLGADNGVGAALILAALEDESLAHGPVEALFTVGEETGMGGAHGIAPEVVESRLLINLDSEEWGHFCVGCAGGVEVAVRRAGRPEAPPDGLAALCIDVRGLAGGHSGIDIGKGRGNAIKLLVRALCAIERRWPFRLATLSGGSASNVLPREASAVLAAPADAVSGIGDLLVELQCTVRGELAGIDDGIVFGCAPGEIARVMDPGAQASWLAALHAAPQGVRGMSTRAPGVVETSVNLGIVDLSPERGECEFLARSLIDSAAAELAGEIASLSRLSGATTEISGRYPGWTPNPESRLLAVCREVYRRNFGGEPDIDVIHAGLECGLIGGKYPTMDMLSFGPTIRGIHAPGERVEVRSVEHCWRLLRETLAALARRNV